MKKIAIIGSTGSIGTQTLQVIDAHKELFAVEVLTANNNIELLIQQARKYDPNIVVIGNESKYIELKEALADTDVKVYAGADAIAQVVTTSTIDIVVTATVGYSGLIPTINAIKAGKTIALANKETLVVAGELITSLVDQYKVGILPVDSEHSAIFQCLVGERMSQVNKLILTASGGPFRGMKAEQLRDVKASDALKHPNWDMGAKVTIDSASLMNKGFEVMEAQWLFGMSPDRIDVLVHPQSIIHSMVEFIDGNVKAQLGVPDMRLPIQYALSYPERLGGVAQPLDFTKYSNLTFEEPDTNTFRNLALAYAAMKKGGNMPCILNAANEIAVDAFLHNHCSFLGMSTLIENCMEQISYISKPSLDDYIYTDKETRIIALELLKKNNY
ncbi:MAG: 1-deoxy-D-xylulose-5-phosphate reductoisomerase [Marinifilaceae bacterium]